MSKLLFKAKLKAAGLHAGLTTLVAILTAALVFGLWYPDALSSMVAGVSLFMIVMAVEVVLGPSMSLVIYNPEKDKAELVRDYTLVGLVQVGALFYGLYTVSISRPVYLVFVKDRIEVVSAVEYAQKDLDEAGLDWQSLPWFGPELICTEIPDDPEEKSDLVLFGSFGKDIQLFPKYYRECKDGEIAERMFTKKQWQLNEQVGLEVFPKDIREGDFGWLPIVTRFGAWTAVYPNKSLEEVQYFDENPFFADAQ